ncbi:MAG: class I SAM-dependent methyltransferase [Bacteroidales bacterium]|nr:class I SAM-dependent methyltransferase [Bacteroidales bacterium]
MGKISKALKALWWIIRKPVLLNRVLTDEDSWRSHVRDTYRLPDGLPVIGMDQLIKTDSVSLGPMTFLDGGSLPTDMMLLASLAESIRDCNYFEIGTWRGESVATLASRVKSCYTLCLTDEEMQAMGMHEKTIESHRLFSEDLDNVTQLRGDSRSFDFRSPGKRFDLIFIDGDHHFDFIKSDTRNVFEHLVHDNSIVVWHDYGFHPDQVRFEVMSAILEGVGPGRAGKVYHVAHTKCAIYTGKSYAFSPAGFPVVPDEYFMLELIRKKIKKPHHPAQ